MKELLLTQEILRSILDYDPATGHFTRKSGRGGTVTGSRAGTLRRGYIWISVNNKLYVAHRLAWLYVHGRWPKEQIDHINMVKSDNRIENLREATYSENGRNRPIPKSNKSGYRGVCFHKQFQKWNANIHHHGKHYSLGLFDSPEEASRAYQRAAQQLHGSFIPLAEEGALT
ncbi:HNH endonuclease [Caballeronia novacaledonica]|uniref:HNH endonuclease n=1 Tax=Caballeronia novacaledonica TaxID=1544861 RepID=A0ACB5R6I0_9BURK|nr:HNH endonuclease [Caballeronia novacaledonica]